MYMYTLMPESSFDDVGVVQLIHQAAYMYIPKITVLVHAC